MIQKLLEVRKQLKERNPEFIRQDTHKRKKLEIKWKKTQKSAGRVRGTIGGTAYWMKRLLHEPAYARKLGENGREHVRENFLLTRHLRDYLLLALYLESGRQDFIHL